MTHLLPSRRSSDLVLKAILATNQGSHAIDLVNISQSGAGFRSAIPLEAGALVNLVLPNDEKRRPALVRWARGLCGGLWFTQPIERSLLASIDRLDRKSTRLNSSH